jgi:hypothetical protein
MSNPTNVKTLTTPQTVLGTVYDTLVVSPNYQVSANTNQVRVAVTVTNSANVANGVVSQQQAGQQANATTKAYTLTVTAFDLATVVAAAVAASGYTVNA